MVINACLIHIIQVFGSITPRKWKIIGEIDHTVFILLLMRQIDHQVVIDAKPREIKRPIGQKLLGADPADGRFVIYSNGLPETRKDILLCLLYVISKIDVIVAVGIRSDQANISPERLLEGAGHNTGRCQPGNWVRFFAIAQIQRKFEAAMQVGFIPVNIIAVKIVAAVDSIISPGGDIRK